MSRVADAAIWERAGISRRHGVSKLASVGVESVGAPIRLPEASVLVPAHLPNEAQRLRALHGTELLYSPAEARFDRISEIACRTFDVPIALVSLVSESSQWFKSVQGLTLTQIPREVSFCGHAILGDTAMVVPDARSDERFYDNPLVTGAPGVRFYACQPIRHKRQPIGTLCLIDTRPRFLDDEQLAQLRSLATWVENEIDSGARSATQRDLAGTLAPEQRLQLIDPLTGTWNRRAGAALLPRELASARAAGQPSALVLVDIDRFSSVNARFGRLGGDFVLAEVARRIRSVVRPHDALIRHSGKQFVLLVAGAPPAVVEGIAHRLLACVAMSSIAMGGEKIELGVSIGAAAVACSRESLLAAMVAGAESALREAKADGRGCVRLRLIDTTLADPPGTIPAESEPQSGAVPVLVGPL